MVGSALSPSAFLRPSTVYPALMKIITNTQLRTVLDEADIMPFAGGLIADASYVLPAENWVRTTFAAAHQVWIKSLGADGWISETNDCDDHARGAAFFASLLHSKTPKAPEAGLAFGEFWYVRADGAGAHAINAAVVPTPRSPRAVAGKSPFGLLFYEPQTFRLVTLTKQEIASCTGYRW